MRASLPANFENVFEARGRDERDAPAFSLKKGVCANRGAADEFETGQVDGGFADSIRAHERLLQMVCADVDGNLQNFKASASKINTVCECAAGINRDAHENEDCIAS